MLHKLKSGSRSNTHNSCHLAVNMKTREYIGLIARASTCDVDASTEIEAVQLGTAADDHLDAGVAETDAVS